ncbi:hypothetical protein Hanom_Chr14g01279861 [Helianthus anomalus]
MIKVIVSSAMHFTHIHLLTNIPFKFKICKGNHLSLLQSYNFNPSTLVQQPCSDTHSTL